VLTLPAEKENDKPEEEIADETEKKKED